MAKFEFRIEKTRYFDIEVEAEDEDRAKEIASQKMVENEINYLDDTDTRWFTT